MAIFSWLPSSSLTYIFSYGNLFKFCLGNHLWMVDFPTPMVNPWLNPIKIHVTLMDATSIFAPSLIPTRLRAEAKTARDLD